MSGYLIAEVWCDGCSVKVRADDEGDVDYLRGDLAGEGWHDNGDIDWCPNCWVPCATCDRPIARRAAHDGGIDDDGEQVWWCGRCCTVCTDGGHEVGS